MVNIRKCVKVAVAMKGYDSIADYCEKKGVLYASIMNWVSDVRRPGLTNLERLAESFDMKVSEFVALGE